MPSDRAPARPSPAPADTTTRSSTSTACENPNGPHAGDLPNLVVNGEGHGRLNAKTDRVTLTSGLATLLDGDGSAFIIHANPDDQVTDAGNGGSGARIACAVIVAGEPRPGF